MTSPTTQKPKIKIVPDTGFYIAALLKKGYARSYLVGNGTKFLSYELFSSEAILLELQEKLEENKFGYSREQVVNLISDIRSVIKIVHPRKKVTVVRDPDDNKIIECALEARAEIVLSFDKDLLDLKEYLGIKIIHPSRLQYM